MHQRLAIYCAIALLGLPLLPAAARAADMKVFKVEIKNHAFAPAAFDVPAGERFKIEVTNRDAMPDEFESHDMKFEKIVMPNATVAVFAGPLHPGAHTFFDDYHPDTKGAVTAIDHSAAENAATGKKD